jgi:hypothetical protein
MKRYYEKIDNLGNIFLNTIKYFIFLLIIVYTLVMQLEIWRPRNI